MGMCEWRSVLRLGLCSAVLLMAGVTQAAIGFADNQSDRIRLWNDNYYEVAFRKTDGRIIYITDKTTGQQVSPGNVYGPWVLRFSNDSWLDGVEFSPTNSSRLFSYSWDSVNEELTLSYTATGTYACKITITIRPTEGPEFDSTLWIQNLSVFEVELLAHPVHFAFRRSQIEGVYVPYQEGMKLLPSFFDSYDYVQGYPGAMFADFAYTELTTGAFAVFGVQDPNAPLRTSEWQILRDSYGGGVNKYHHDYTLALLAGRSWTSPTIVISVGSTLAEAMDSYWTRNHYDEIPALAEKLGPTLFEKLAGAVLFKRDFLQGSWTFGSYLSYLPNIPPNNLLHFVAFWPNGFDENYPDYLPPHTSLGNLAAFQNLIASARAMGHLVMPYTNPTWWDDQTSTYANLGSDIVTKDRDGNLIGESYGTHFGYVVSPYDPDVIARQDQTRSEFTLTAPCDLLFEDQLGARSQPKYAAHPDAPDPTLYTQGLVEVAQRSSQALPIMSEGGFDRLSFYESGFCVSHTVGWHWWPDSTFEIYPMVPLWAHENLMFYAHNLAGAAMANDLPSLTYYISIGYSLIYNEQDMDYAWMSLLDNFQKHFVASMVGVEMTGFELLGTSGYTRASFANGTTITANLTDATRMQDDHELAINGFVAQQDGQVLAGVLHQLHGQALSGSNPHYLIFEYAPYAITCYQPSGTDTNLTLPRPTDWSDSSRITLKAVTEAGAEVAMSLTIGADTLTFYYLQATSGQPLDRFVVTYCSPGDADCDGDIDGDDQLAFEDCFSGPEGTIVPSQPPLTESSCTAAFDFDEDGDIDASDAAVFQDAFGAGM